MGLEARNISLTLGRRKLLNDVCIHLKDQEVLALIGRSGSGKTMLLRILCGLLLPDEGDVVVDNTTYVRDGESVKPAWQLRRKVGIVFQNYSLLPNFTARRNITLALRHVMGMEASDANIEAEKVATLLSISHVLERYPSTLSGGEQQRLSLARSLVLRPRVLLLDEVTSALDPETTTMLISGIEKMRKAQLELFTTPSAVLLVTHEFAFAERFADRILFLSEGSIVEDLPSEKFYSDAKSPEARQYLCQLSHLRKKSAE
jgi:ABC-type polar amino acid transport system ATPase subunit